MPRDTENCKNHGEGALGGVFLRYPYAGVVDRVKGKRKAKWREKKSEHFKRTKKKKLK